VINLLRGELEILALSFFGTNLDSQRKGYTKRTYYSQKARRESVPNTLRMGTYYVVASGLEKEMHCGKYNLIEKKERETKVQLIGPWALSSECEYGK